MHALFTDLRGARRDDPIVLMPIRHTAITRVESLVSHAPVL